MALINCPKCGKTVSDKAVQCPHCGGKLGKEFIIQKHSNDELTIIIIKYIVIACTALLGGAMSILPLSAHVYKMGVCYRPIDNLGTAFIANLTVGVGVIGGIICLGIIGISISRIIMRKSLSTKFLLYSLSISVAFPLCTFLFILSSFNHFYSLYQEKTDNVEGTFEFVNQDKKYTFSVNAKSLADKEIFCIWSSGLGLEYQIFESNSLCIAEGENDYKEGYISMVSYDFNEDLIKININVDHDHIYISASTDMSNVYIDGRKVPLKKISNSVMAKEEAEKRFVEKQRKTALEDYKNFQTLDLAAYMLHGRVKRVEESYGGTVGIYYYFDNNGQLVREGNDYDDDSVSTSSSNNKCTIQYGSGHQKVYTFDSMGRLVQDEYSKYSDYNEHGWPTKMVDISSGEATYFTYTDVDEHGNWEKRECTNSHGSYTMYRYIEYYP